MASSPSARSSTSMPWPRSARAKTARVLSSSSTTSLRAGICRRSSEKGAFHRFERFRDLFFEEHGQPVLEQRQVDAHAAGLNKLARGSRQPAPFRERTFTASDQFVFYHRRVSHSNKDPVTPRH